MSIIDWFFRQAPPRHLDAFLKKSSRIREETRENKNISIQTIKNLARPRVDKAVTHVKEIRHYKGKWREHGKCSSLSYSKTWEEPHDYIRYSLDPANNSDGLYGSCLTCYSSFFHDFNISLSDHARRDDSTMFTLPGYSFKKDIVLNCPTSGCDTSIPLEFLGVSQDMIDDEWNRVKESGEYIHDCA